MIDVVIPTHNGLDTLPPSLDALAAAIERANAPVHIYAVANGCTDDTADYLRSRDDLPMTVLETETGGKNRAINWALRESSGELVVSLDDDVIVPPDYFADLSRLAAAHPEHGVFSGPIVPRFADPLDDVKTNFLTPMLRIVLFAEQERGDEGDVPTKSLWGPILAFRRSAVEPQPFDEDVGPDGSETYAMGSETSFLTAQHKRGVRSIYSEALRARHLIIPRMTGWDYMFSRATRYGRGQMKKMLDHEGETLNASGFSVFHLRRAAQHYLAYAARRLSGNKGRALTEAWWARVELAQAAEYREQAKARG